MFDIELFEQYKKELQQEFALEAVMWKQIQNLCTMIVKNNSPSAVKKIENACELLVDLPALKPGSTHSLERLLMETYNMKQGEEEVSKLMFAHPSPVLFVTLKRFSWDKNLGGLKNYTKIKYPFELRIKQCLYLLKSVILHSGDLNHGHYITNSFTYSQDNKLEYYTFFNDENIKCENVKQVGKQVIEGTSFGDEYIFVYERVKEDQVQQKEESAIAVQEKEEPIVIYNMTKYEINERKQNVLVGDSATTTIEKVLALAKLETANSCVLKFSNKTKQFEMASAPEQLQDDCNMLVYHESYINFKVIVMDNSGEMPVNIVEISCPCDFTLAEALPEVLMDVEVDTIDEHGNPIEIKLARMNAGQLFNLPTMLEEIMQNEKYYTPVELVDLNSTRLLIEEFPDAFIFVVPTVQKQQ